MIDCLKEITQSWYIHEPALFTVLCTHNVEENKSILCPFRCGRGRIEYNAELLSTLSHEEIEEYLKAEVVRIILKHPYERQPDGCGKQAKSIGSDIVLSDNYKFKQISLSTTQDYGLNSGGSFEQYSYQIQDILGKEKETEEFEISAEGSENSASQHPEEGEMTSEDSNSDVEIQLPDGTVISLKSSDKSNLSTENSETSNAERELEKRTFDSKNAKSDNSELWEEDSLKVCEIDNAISEIESGHKWGSLAGSLSELIIANTKARIDYRKAFSGFRATILSSKRRLTRMRPNRRSGFDNMGSIRNFTTRLLVAVDVSGSISSESLRHFYSILNRFYKYGIESVDVVRFDAELGEVESLKKATKTIQVFGRGGTSFQPAIDFAAKSMYDGLIIFTDGYAPQPDVTCLKKCKLLWICDSQSSYNKNKDWMQKTGRCCMIEL